MHAPGCSLIGDNVIFLHKNKVKEDFQTDLYLLCMFSSVIEDVS